MERCYLEYYGMTEYEIGKDLGGERWKQHHSRAKRCLLRMKRRKENVKV